MFEGPSGNRWSCPCPTCLTWVLLTSSVKILWVLPAETLYCQDISIFTTFHSCCYTCNTSQNFTQDMFCEGEVEIQQCTNLSCWVEHLYFIKVEQENCTVSVNAALTLILQYVICLDFLCVPVGKSRQISQIIPCSSSWIKYGCFLFAQYGKANSWHLDMSTPEDGV